MFVCPIFPRKAGDIKIPSPHRNVLISKLLMVIIYASLRYIAHSSTHMYMSRDRSRQIDNASVPIKTADEREGFLLHLRNI
jgi:hypothetical protein